MTDKQIMDIIGEKINQAERIAIISHIRPDGDTLGSALALKNSLNGQKYCEVFCDDDFPPKYNFLKGYNEIKNDGLKNFDLIIAVDCSDLNRLGGFFDIVKRHKNTVNIDHHISNDKYADINYVMDVSSTCEIIYYLLNHLNIEINKETAECIYCGLSSDTGNFSHSNTTYKTFETAAALSRQIGDISYINQKIYKEMPFCRLKLLGHVISNIKMFFNNKMAVLTIFLEDLKRYDCPSYETEGLVDYSININGVEVGVILLQHDKNSYKVSFRSKNVDVCKLAAQFGGGGHIHASGCMIFGSYEEVMEKLIKNAGFYIG